MVNEVTRRNLLSSVAVGAAAMTAGQAAYFAGPRPAHAAFTAKGNIPDKPFKTGHITFLTGPANLLGEPGRKGHLMAAEEINAEGGFLGKR
jgi:branched-chain amino acid transport system substrate-binding protein